MAKTTTTKSKNTDIQDTGGGKTPFIDSGNAADAYDESKRWMRVYFDPLDELERIARNRPSPNIDPTLPRVTDGTMAAIIQESPKRIIQQLSTGKVTCPDYAELAAVADIVLNERLLPLYNRMGSALQKDWNMLGKSMTYGRATSYTFFTSTNGQFHTDFVIPYIKDVLDEKGKVFGPDNNIRFLRSWYQKRDLQAIINREKRLQGANKNYKSEWDLGALGDFLESGASAKPADVMTPAEKEKGGDTGGFEVIHAMQLGQGAEFYSFAPRMALAKDSKSGDGMLRTKINSDPRGRLPLDDLYCNIDLSNPIGRGQVELSGGVQNLIDQQMQMYQFIMTLLMGPPLQVWGSVDKSRLKFLPNAVWDMGNNLNNKVEPYAVDNTAISTFPNNYGLLKSQILNLNSSQDHSISSEAGNPAQSKTQAGVQAQEQRLSITDNYLRKQFEDWDSDQRETSLNIFFSEMKGTDTIELGPAQIRELSTTRGSVYIDQKTGKLNIPYSKIKDAVFKFQSDPGSSKTADDADQMQRLQEAIKEVNENGPVVNWYMGQNGQKLNVGEMYTQLFKRMGLENLDSIISEMNPEEKQRAMQAPFPIIDKPQIRLTGQLPTSTIPAALGAGGVQVDPNSVRANPLEQLDLGDVYKDPNTTNMIRAQIQALAGLQPDMNAINQPSAGTQPAPAAPSGPSPDEVALRQQDLAIKQQNADVKKVQVAADISNQAHQQTIEMHNAAMAAAQPPQQPGSADNSQPTGNPGNSETTATQPPALDGALNDDEQKLAATLLHRGFSEGDVEQAIVMLRRRMPASEIIKVLGAKNATRA